MLDVADALRHRFQIGGFGQQLLGVTVEKLPRFGELERTRATLKQLHAQFFFKLLNLAAQRRLGDKQLFSGAGKALLLGHGHKIAQMSKLHMIPFEY